MIKFWEPKAIANAIARFFLRWVDKHAKAEMDRLVNARSGVLAKAIAVGYLEREGLLHCGACLKRSPLRRVGPWYSCPDHVDVMEAQLLKAATSENSNQKPLNLKVINP